jgi:hypothetical protein
MKYIQVPILADEVVRECSASELCRYIDRDKAKQIVDICLTKLSDVDLELLTRQIDVELCKEVDQFSL